MEPAPKKVTRKQALEFAIECMESIAGGSEPGYGEECRLAANTLKSMLARIVIAQRKAKRKGGG